jgi:hypothetical protein
MMPTPAQPTRPQPPPPTGAQPAEGVPYYQPSLAALNRRPTSVSVIAILAVIFGAISTLSLFNLILIPLSEFMGPQVFPDPLTRYWGIVYSALAGSMGAWELLGGIQSLRRKESGRKKLLLFANVNIVIATACYLFNLIFISPHIGQDVNIPHGAESFSFTTSHSFELISEALYLCFASGWSLCILFYLKKPIAREWFAGGRP